MKREILRMQNVCLPGKYQYYGLEDFHVHLCEGEMVNILSLSNEKRSLLYEYFTGKVPLAQGRVWFDKKSLLEGTLFQNKEDVICIGQKVALIPGLSIAENICVINGKHKPCWKDNKHRIFFRARILLAQYAPELRPQTLVRELSQKEMRIVELLRAVQSETKLVVIDDVFSGYGRNDCIRIQELIEELKKKKTAILYNCHNTDFFREFADRTVVLRNGRNVHTFFEGYYDEIYCMKLMIGNEKLSPFQRKSTVRPEITFEICHLTGGNWVKNVNMQFQKGEIVGLYDLNNRKNLELLRIITGQIPLQKGFMYLNGTVYEPGNENEMMKMGVGFISREMEENGLVGTMDAADNLCLPLMKRMGTTGFFRKRKLAEFLVREHLEELGIPPDKVHEQVRYFDDYIKLNILMLRWKLVQPVFMICEEPFGNADMIKQNIIFRALADLAEHGCTVLIESQYKNELQTICDTVYALNSGENMEDQKYTIRQI